MNTNYLLLHIFFHDLFLDFLIILILQSEQVNAIAQLDMDIVLKFQVAVRILCRIETILKMRFNILA